MGKLHILEEKDAIKPGDRVKLIDKLTPEERKAIKHIRELGDAKVLDEKACLLEDIAGSARHNANAALRLEKMPWLIPDAEYVSRPTWALAAVVLNVLVLVAVVAAVAAMRGNHSPTLPPKSIEEPGGQPPHVPPRLTSNEKGRAER